LQTLCKIENASCDVLQASEVMSHDEGCYNIHWETMRTQRSGKIPADEAGRKEKNFKATGMRYD
jgi:hypothetical protein